MKLLHFSALFVYILLFCPGIISEPASQAAAVKKNTLPFKGTYATISEPLSAPPFLQLRITGTGQSTHLGRGTFVALSTMNLTTPPPFSIGGTTTFYAANGDEFYTSFTGTATPIGDGRLEVEMTHEITGGTGRFANASGTITGYTLAGLAVPDAQITYEGTISY
jgi:hypothetical protein